MNIIQFWKNRSKLQKIIIILSITLLILIVIIWYISTPKVPSVPKPADIFYCEKDDDCTTIGVEEGNCCAYCQYAVNKDAKLYLEKWNKLKDNSLYSNFEYSYFN